MPFYNIRSLPFMLNYIRFPFSKNVTKKKHFLHQLMVLLIWANNSSLLFSFFCNGLSIGELCCSDDLWLFEYKNNKKKIGIKINMVVGLLLVTLGLLLFIFVKNRYAYLVIPIPIGFGSLIFNSITNHS